MYVSITVFKANGDILRESPAAAVTSSGTDAGPGRALTEDANSEEFSIKAFHTSHPHPARPVPHTCMLSNCHVTVQMLIHIPAGTTTSDVVDATNTVCETGSQRFGFAVSDCAVLVGAPPMMPPPSSPVAPPSLGAAERGPAEPGSGEPGSGEATADTTSALDIPIGIIIAVVASVAGLIVIIGVCLFCYCRRRKKAALKEREAAEQFERAKEAAESERQQERQSKQAQEVRVDIDAGKSVDAALAKATAEAEANAEAEAKAEAKAARAKARAEQRARAKEQAKADAEAQAIADAVARAEEPSFAEQCREAAFADQAKETALAEARAMVQEAKKQAAKYQRRLSSEPMVRAMLQEQSQQPAQLPPYLSSTPPDAPPSAQPIRADKPGEATSEEARRKTKVVRRRSRPPGEASSQPQPQPAAGPIWNLQPQPTQQPQALCASPNVIKETALNTDFANNPASYSPNRASAAQQPASSSSGSAAHPERRRRKKSESPARN